MSEDGELLTPEFLALGFVVFCAFCQIALFYGLMAYLERIGIPKVWRGPLVSLEPLTAFLLRPLVVPLIHGGNALRVLLASLALVVLVLLGYPFATTIPAMAALRVMHGIAFLLLVSAAMSLFVLFIPRSRSGAAFGFIGVATQMPYAIMPALAERLLPRMGNESRVYALMSCMGVVALLALLAITPRLKRALSGLPQTSASRPSWPELKEDLGRRAVQRLLLLNALLFLASTTIFFFMKGWLATLGRGRVDLFFTLSILAGLGIRLLGGTLFDRFEKTRVLWGILSGLGLVFLLLPRVPAGFYLLAPLYGALLATAFALLNGLMFEVSEPRFRGLNSNMMMVMMDAGFFLAPTLGGLLLERGLGYTALFSICGLLCALGALFLTGMPPASAHERQSHG